MTYNLNEEEPESFEFTLNGNTYRMKYPTTDDILNIAKIKDQSEQIDKMYEFISADEGVPSIRESLGKSSIKVMQRFNKMIQTEFMGDA